MPNLHNAHNERVPISRACFVLSNLRQFVNDLRKLFENLLKEISNFQAEAWYENGNIKRKFK